MSRVSTAGARQVMWLGVVLAAIWAILTENAGWGFGFIAVVAALVSSVLLAPLRSVRWSAIGLLRFLPYFFQQSLLGGTDVAWRALHPTRPVAPSWLTYPLRLPSGPARTVFASTINLLPGTLNTALERDCLEIHTLVDSAGTYDELVDLEKRVAAIFSIDLTTDQLPEVSSE